MSAAKRLPSNGTTAGVRLHPTQSTVFRDLFVKKEISNAVTCAARGYGKSVLAAACAIKAIEECVQMPPGTPNRNVALIAPTHSQAVDIYYPLLAYQFGILPLTTKSSRRDGTFWFGPEVLLKIWSAEAVERMRGTGQYFVVNDEIVTWEMPGSTQQEAWESVISPCMTTRWPGQARSLTISTPKGMDFFFDMYQYEHTDPENWRSYHYDYHQSPYLEDFYIEQQKLLLDPLKFAREYEASFEDSGAQVFYPFDRKVHVDKSLPWFTDGEDVHACIDFNIGIMACSVFALRGNQLHFIDEFRGHRDTDQLTKTLKEKYLDYGHRVIAYPDPTGHHRKTSAAVGVTDFSIIKTAGIPIRARRKSPPIIDSVAAVNRQLMNAREQISMYIHPNCVNTIRSLERTVWLERNPESAQIDKTAGDEHFTDGIRYATEYLFPIQAGGKRVSYNARRLL